MNEQSGFTDKLLPDAEADLKCLELFSVKLWHI